tara:strand:+ start:79 stop:1428 length:1350 start_codon:yes stop_codon:yes gene_type:complete
MQTDQVKNIHIISIGGSVMHDLAITLKKLGNIVTGSDDIIYDPSKSKLKSKGLLPKELGYFKKNIHNKIDFVITGMHTKKNNVELNEARKKNIPILSYPEYITKLSENKHRVVIAGSHGKTTITSMIMHVLKSNKIKFDYVIGAKAHGFKNNISISNNPIIIIEGDEYLTSPLDRSPKFLKYNHHIALINGIEWDHFNVFKNEKIYVDQFYKLIKMTPKGGEIIYFENDKRIIGLLEKYKNENTTLKPYSHEKYSFNKKSAFILDENNKKIKLNVFGKHNMQNIAGAKIICEQLGVKTDYFYKSISSYKLPHRRLQIISDKKNKIFRDFAHSPSKLMATINAVKLQYSDKLLSVYELHSSSSFDFTFLKNYKDTLDGSDFSVIYISENNLKKFSKEIDENMIKNIFNEKKLVLISNKKELDKYINNSKYKSYNKLLMSSGNFDGYNVGE